ncbi:MAG: OstA-like protein [Candidatus Omnitrophota bacterium]
MKRIIVIIFIAVFSFVSFFAFADEESVYPSIGKIDKSSKEPVVINGDTVEYSETGKTASATGNVSLTYQNLTLTCDKAVFHLDTKEIYSEGNVILTQGESYFKGERVVYNFETKVGTVLKPKVFIAPLYYGAGQEVDKTSDKNYEIKRGYITTCDREHPHYRVQSKQIKVYLGDRITAKHITLYVMDTPIFYFPYYSHSLKDKYPGVTVIPGENKDWGYYILTSWRYYLNENFKGRINFDYRERKEFAGGVDLNYNTANFGDGAVRTYYIHEKDLQRKHLWSKKEEEEGESAEEKDRYRVQLRHKWQMDPLTVGILESSKMSDAAVIKDYFLKDYQRDMSNTTYASVIRSEDCYTTSFLAQKRINNFDSMVEYLPELKFETRNLKISDTNFYYEGKASGGNLNRKFPSPSNLDYHATRFDVDNKLSYQTNLLGWLWVTPFAGTKQTFYSRGAADDRGFIRGDFFTGIDTSARFYHTYDIKSNIFNLEINKLRHIISPSVSYNYVHRPTVGGGRVPQFDDLDSVGFANVISPSIENKLQTKKTVGGKIESVDIARFIVSTDYNFSFENKKGGRLSYYNLSFESRPYNWMRILSNSIYNPHRDRFESFSFDIGADPDADIGLNLRDFVYSDIEKKKWSYAGGYRWDNDIGSQLEGQFMLNLSAKWKLTAYERFNFKKFEDMPDGTRKKLINNFAEQEYRLGRDLHCWIGEIVYNITSEHGHTVMAVFRLKAFPLMPLEFEKTYYSPRFGSQLPPG